MAFSKLRSSLGTCSYSIHIRAEAGLRSGLRQPRVSAKFELRHESLKIKFSLILFAYNGLDARKRIAKIIRQSAFDKKKKKPGLKFNPRVTLTGVLGPDFFNFIFVANGCCMALDMLLEEVPAGSSSICPALRKLTFIKVMTSCKYS